MIRTSCRALLNLIGGQCGKSNAFSVGVYAIEENCLFISEINIPFIDSEYLYLLPMMLFSFLLLAYGIFANNIQSEILKRERGSKRLREILDE